MTAKLSEKAPMNSSPGVSGIGTETVGSRALATAGTEAPLPARLTPSARSWLQGPSLAAGMAAADHGPDIQLSQARHRSALMASRNIAPGSTVPELGCTGRVLARGGWAPWPRGGQ
jgi:hypothetical protein